ncbi:hypothetical protein ACA910_000779 [Epithemia clementina (nom. ined.)]
MPSRKRANWRHPVVYDHDNTAGRRTTRAAATGQKRSNSSSMSSMSEKHTSAGAGNSNYYSVRRERDGTFINISTSRKRAKSWVEVPRPPGPGIRFLVPTWIPVDDLTAQEREKYLPPETKDEAQDDEDDDDDEEIEDSEEESETLNYSQQSTSAANGNAMDRQENQRQEIAASSRQNDSMANQKNIPSFAGARLENTDNPAVMFDFSTSATEATLDITSVQTPASTEFFFSSRPLENSNVSDLPSQSAVHPNSNF